MNRKHKLMLLAVAYAAVLFVIITYFCKDSFALYAHFESVNSYVRSLRDLYFPTFHQQYDNITQLVPGLALIVMKMYGVKGMFGWKQLLLFIFLSIFFTQIVVNGIKLSTDILRPDGSNLYSFPSGHTTAAFMTATLLYRQYGSHHLRITMLAYSFAILTGITRILNNRHWLFDVLVGAALGFLLTDAVYWLLKRRSVRQ